MLVLEVALLDGEVRFAAPMIQCEIEAVAAALAQQEQVIDAHNRATAASLDAFVNESWSALNAMRRFGRPAYEHWRTETRKDLLRIAQAAGR